MDVHRIPVLSFRSVPNVNCPNPKRAILHAMIHQRLHASVRNLGSGLFLLAATLLTAGAASFPEPISSPTLHPLFRISTHVFSGGAPEGDAAFAELRRLGVSTVVSVDGSRPDVEAARKHSLRYLHLPIGYDGIPGDRLAQLVNAVPSATNVFFIHCHHGKHRGPSAAAIVCLASDHWSPQQAVDWLRLAGTSPEYPGLYQSVATFNRPNAAALAAVPPPPETATRSTVVDSMVALDTHTEHLAAARETGWTNIPGHPDLDPRHEATLLWEQLRELARHSSTSERPADYRTSLTASEQAAYALRSALAKSPRAPAAADTAFKQLNTSCATCHKAHRN